MTGAFIAAAKRTPVRADAPICKLKTEVRNGAGETCPRGTATTYTTPLAWL